MILICGKVEDGKAMRSVGILLNPSKAQAMTIANTLRECAAGLGMTCSFVAEDIEADAYEKKPDVLIVLGGDGTILRAVDYCSQHDIPILGINLGRVGFLTELDPEKAQEMLRALAQDEYTLEKRMLMEVTLPDGRCARALNDVVVSRGTSSRMIALDASTSDELIDHYVADGLIISTPTGSTAYSLSAGGPIVSPSVNCFILAPICAHSLKARPIVLSDREELRISLNMKEEREGMSLTIDGQQMLPIANKESIDIRRAGRDIAFVRFLHKQNFFALLRTKLSDWSL